MTSDVKEETQRQSAAVIDGDGQLGAGPPPHPTPMSEIVAALRNVDLLQGLTEEEYCWLASHGTERVASHRAVVVRENEPAHHMNIILQGEVNVHRANSGSVSLFIGRTARVTGKLPFSRMKFWGATGYSAGHLWVLDIHEDLFPAMLAAIPSMAQICVSLLLDRVRDFSAPICRRKSLLHWASWPPTYLTNSTIQHLLPSELLLAFRQRSTKTMNCTGWAACSARIKNWKTTSGGRSVGWSQSRTGRPGIGCSRSLVGE